MDIKVIATDLDGTLLYKKTYISKKNTIALKQFIEFGGIVCFVTGRSIQSANKFALKFQKQTGLKIHYISGLKGSVILDNINNTFIYKKSINSELTNKIVEIVVKHKCSLGSYLTEDILTKRTVIYNLNSLVKTLRIFKAFKGYEIIKKWNPNNEVYKMNLCGINFRVPFWKWKCNLINCYNEIKSTFNDQLEISKTSPNMYEITNNGCNKGITINKISELLKINPDKFAAFGDSNNDVEMFKEAGLSILIGHKKTITNKYANYKIKWFKKNAVAKGINKYIFNKK